MFSSKLFILFLMIFLHIVDDYYLQGKLALMKQKKWWEENYPQDMYKNDYKVALIAHSFSWSFLSMLPLAIYEYNNLWCVIVLVNMLIHYIIDDLKANDLLINLMQDQAIHYCQIIISWIIYLKIIIG